ncbi:MAG: hypothetical protein IKV68_01800 [Oscillospiraceae bacterium]|nr:hypothetical protein [Oscillospiraceae bacterium]
MGLYPDYAPKKKRFSLFGGEEPKTVFGGEEEKESIPAEPLPPRFCLRCTDTEMKFFRNLKVQLEGYYGPGSIYSLFEDEDDPDSLSLLPLDMYVCPKCRRTELVWCLGVDPGGEERPDKAVLKYERTFERCTEEQLRQVLEGENFSEDMKTAARNLLERNFFGWE